MSSQNSRAEQSKNIVSPQLQKNMITDSKQFLLVLSFLKRCVTKSSVSNIQGPRSRGGRGVLAPPPPNSFKIIKS